MATQPVATTPEKAGRILCAFLIVGSIALLSWFAGRALPRVSVGNGPVVDWVIESVPRPEGDANRPSLFVHMVLADGVLQRVSELQRTGSWHNYNLWASECSTAAGPPARITVRARNLTLKLSGRADGCRVRIAGGALTTEVDLYRTAYDDIWVDLPEVPPTRLGYVVALLLTALAAALRPWRGGRLLTSWLLIHLSLLHALYWASLPIAANGDTPGYFDALIQYLEHGKPTYFPPGYPLMLGACQWFTTSVGVAVTLVQHAMVVFCFHGLFVMLREGFGQTAAFAVALVGGSTWTALATPQMAMSETVATFGMGAGLYLVWSTRHHPTTWRAVCGGLAIGLATLARAVPFAAALPAAMMVTLLPWRQRRWRPLLQCATATAAVLLASVVYTGLRSGKATLSTGAPAHLYNHFVTYQRLMDESGPRTREMLTLTGRADLRGVPHWDVRPALVERGLNDDQILPLMGDVAWEAARQASLLEHLVCVLGLAWAQVLADPSPTSPTTPSIATRCLPIENCPPLPPWSGTLIVGQRLQALHIATWPAIAWLFLAGVLIIPFRANRWTLLAIAWLPLGYLLATSCVEYFLERYNIAVYPFTFVIAAIPILVIVRFASNRLARPRSGVAVSPTP
jgi:hypothetical protein